MARDTRRAYLELLDTQSKVIRDAFLAAVGDATVASESRLAAIIDHLEAGDIPAAVAASMVPDSFWARVDRSMQGAFVAGALYQQEALPLRPFGPGAPALVVGFDGRNPRAEQWMRTQSSRLITEISTSQREAAIVTLAEGLEAGRNPRAVALDLVGRKKKGQRLRRGGTIGLHSQDAGYVAAMRAELADPATASKYFSRAARDKRFDRTVAKAIREGRPVLAARIDAAASQYSNRLLRNRGESIGRTEATAALNAGRREGMAQVIEDTQNEIEQSDTTRTWMATAGPRTRDQHAEMDGQSRPFGEPFVAPDGSRLMHPGDSSLGAPAKQVVKCRCYEQIRVDYLAVARRRRAAA